jgi:predicted metal-dependent phosphoesterase TrpH
VPDEVIARLAAAGLAGVEVWHPEQSQAERDRARRLADELGLVATGGSDDHGALTGYRIGAESTPAEAWLRLAAQASGTPS